MRKRFVFFSTPADKYLIATTITTVMAVMCRGPGRNLSPTGADRDGGRPEEAEAGDTRDRRKEPGFALCLGTCVAGVNMWKWGTPSESQIPTFSQPLELQLVAWVQPAPHTYSLTGQGLRVLDPRLPQTALFLAQSYELGTWTRGLPGSQSPRFLS